MQNLPILKWTMIMLSTFYLGFLGMMMKRLHLLSILLCLELMLMSIFLMLSMWMFNMESSLLMPMKMILLALSASEASTGLSLMVALSRTHKSDLINSMKILQQ